MSAIFLNQIWLSIYPVAAVSSQSLLDLVTFFMFFTTIVILYRSREKIDFKRIGIEWAVLGYLIVIALGFKFNASPDAEWQNSVIKFSWLINIYILIYTFQTLSFNSIKVIQVLSVLSLGPTVYSLISYLNGLDLITNRDNDRITGLVNSSTYHAHGNAVLFVILVGCLYFSIRKLSRAWMFFSLFSTFLLGLSIFLTFTRGIWISIFASSMMMLFYLDWKKMLKIFLTSVVLFFLAFQYWGKFKERILKTNVKSNDERVSLFKLNVQIWKEYPLLGIGYGENLRRNREYWDRPEWNKPPGYLESHAHNQFLNVLATTGVFGLFFFSLIFGFFFKKNFGLIRKTNQVENPERRAILIICFWAQLEFVIGCLTDVSFEYAKIRALIILVWALLIAIERKADLIIENRHA